MSVVGRCHLSTTSSDVDASVVGSGDKSRLAGNGRGVCANRRPIRGSISSPRVHRPLALPILLLAKRRRLLLKSCMIEAVHEGNDGTALSELIVVSGAETISAQVMPFHAVAFARPFWAEAWSHLPA